MTTMERLVKVFCAVFEDQIDPAAITEQTTLLGDLGMTSISLLYMAMATEEEFGVKFLNEDFATLVTVGDVVKCVERKA